MNIYISGSITSDYIGYSRLIRDLYPIVYASESDNILFDFSELKWLDANLLTVIGSIFQAKKGKNRIQYVNDSIKPVIMNLWARNGFGSYFKIKKVFDLNGTTVDYKVSNGNNLNEYSDYISKQLLSMSNLPVMSEGLKKQIKNNLLEIFGNAPMHGKCEQVISCGQVFPAKNILCFTITNIGTTIMDNVQEYFTTILKQPTPSNTIKWATGENHSTKILVNGKSGGLGLSFLKEFIEKNKGKIQICSGNEYWEFNSGIETVNTFNEFFPGTIVTLIINLNDKSSYCLKTELLNDDIIF